MKKLIFSALALALVGAIACKKELTQLSSNDDLPNLNLTNLPSGIDQWHDMLWFNNAQVMRDIVNDTNFELDVFNQIGGFISYETATEELDTNILEGAYASDVDEIVEQSNLLFYKYIYIDENDSTIVSLEAVIDCEYMAHFANHNRSLRVGDSVYTFFSDRLEIVHSDLYESGKRDQRVQHTVPRELNYFGYSGISSDVGKRRTSCRTSEYTHNGKKFRFRGYLAAARTGHFHKHITLVTRHYKRGLFGHWYGKKAPEVKILDGEIHYIYCPVYDPSVPCVQQLLTHNVTPDSKNNKKKVRQKIHTPVILESSDLRVNANPPEGSWSKHGGKQRNNTVVDCTGYNIHEGF